MGPGKGLRVCISYKRPAEAEAAGAWVILRLAGPWVLDLIQGWDSPHRSPRSLGRLLSVESACLRGQRHGGEGQSSVAWALESKLGVSFKADGREDELPAPQRARRPALSRAGWGRFRPWQSPPRDPQEDPLIK